MIAVRMSDDDEQRFAELARRAGMTSGPFARRVLEDFMNGQTNRDAAMLGKLTKLERMTLRVERKVDSFLKNAEFEFVEPD